MECHKVQVTSSKYAEGAYLDPKSLSSNRLFGIFLEWALLLHPFGIQERFLSDSVTHDVRLPLIPCLEKRWPYAGMRCFLQDVGPYKLANFAPATYSSAKGSRALEKVG